MTGGVGFNAIVRPDGTNMRRARFPGRRKPMHVHAQRVDVELVDPVQRAANQVVDDLAPAEVEDQRSPVAVLTLARIGMFIDGIAGEAGECEVVFREVPGNPVEKHPDTGLMATID